MKRPELSRIFRWIRETAVSTCPPRGNLVDGLPRAPTWLVETEIFSLCKAILYRPTPGQSVAKRVCRYIKNNFTKREISFETTVQISTSVVLDGDKGSRFQILKARGPGKFISPRLTAPKVLKKCSILENRSLSRRFA